MKNTLDKIIADYLNNTKKRCKFKMAFIPKGWTCIKIKKVSSELSKAIERCYVGRNEEKG